MANENPTSEPMSREQLKGELRALILTAEELLEQTANQAGEGLRDTRARFENALGQVKGKLASAEDSIVAAARRKAAAADEYAHHHPWQTVGVFASVAAGVGLLLGMLIGRR